MSGRGRQSHSRMNNRGCGFGRESGRFGNRRNKSGKKPNNNGTMNSSMMEMKFAPRYPGKPQKVTYDHLKDHIIILIQNTYKNGQYIAEAIRK